MRILFVCLGNICRSPIAEGVMRELVRQQGVPWTVGSAGTNSYHTGEPPHRHSQRVCAERGVDISGQRARRFCAEDFADYDLVYAMADDVLDEMRSMAGPLFDEGKASLFLDELYPGEHRSVPDPWYGDLQGYYPVYAMIEEGCRAILKKYS